MELFADLYWSRDCGREHYEVMVPKLAAAGDSVEHVFPPLSLVSSHHMNTDTDLPVICQVPVMISDDLTCCCAVLCDRSSHKA